MIEFNRIFMITVRDKEEDELINKTFSKPYWLGEIGMKMYPKSYFVDLTKDNEKLVKKLIKDKKAEEK